MTKKRHHYIPKVYLKFFCDEQGMVRVYRKEEPTKVFLQSPDSLGFHKYFYSQPLPGGGEDHERLENVFSEIEAKWPSIVEKLRNKQDVNDVLEDVFEFMALQRARVPASRDATEKIDAEIVKATMRALDAAGELPPKPEGFENLLDRVEVSIDPHRSIHAMGNVLQGMERVFDRVGIAALHNMTDVPFLTSDNPVVWFDPSVPEAEMLPYVTRLYGPITLLFPVTPRLMIYGHSALKDQFAPEGMGIGELNDGQLSETINRQICRFAYQAVFAQAPGQEHLIEEHAHVSPVVHTTTIPGAKGMFIFNQVTFGRRERKPKWKD